MASRRLKLSQRRKAVGFTQESLAEHLGVERSTVIRWEAGDSEPLPSIRPSLARALQVSIDQLAELLTRSEIAGSTRTLTADPEVAMPAPLPEAAPQGRPDGAEFENLIRPQIAETVEALRRALQSAGVSAEDLAAMLLIGGSSAAPLAVPGSGVSEDHRRRRTRSRKRKRLVAAGAFALLLPAVWLSATFPQSGANPQVVARAPEPAIPVDAIPVPNPGADHDKSAPNADPIGAANTAPSAAPDTVPGGPAQPVVSQTSRASAKGRAASRSHRSTATTRPAVPRTPAEMMATAGVDRHWDGFDQFERASHLW